MTEPAGAPQSPFLPGTQIRFAWDSTTLGALKTCARLYQYQYIDGYISKEENIHLRFGIEYHTAIEEYHKARASGAKRMEAFGLSTYNLLCRTFDWKVDTDTPTGKYKNRKNLLALVVDYLDHIKDDATKTYIREDGRAAVELSFRFELDWGPRACTTCQTCGGTQSVQELSGLRCNDCGDAWPQPQPYLLCGHLDQIVNFNDSLFVMDHKTSKTTLGDYYFDQYTPNNQMTLYSLAAKIVIDSPVRGVIIDAAQIKLTEPNAFKRGMAMRTPELLEEWTADLRFWFDQAERFAIAGYWPMNDMACGMYGGCKFREVCSKSPSTRKVYLKSDFTQLPPEERWNPLKER